MKKINASGASWNSIFLACSKILTLLFGIISAKLLSVGLSLEEYGTYSQANLVATVGATVIMLGLVDALNFFFNKKTDESEYTEDEKAKTVNTVFFMEMAIGLVLAALIIFGRSLIGWYFHNPAVEVLLFAVAFMPMMTNIIYFYHVVYVATGKAKLLSILSLIMMLVRIVTVYFAVYVASNVIWIYVMVLAMDVLQVVIFVVQLARRGIVINPFNILPSKIWPIIKYAFPMGIFALTSSLTRDLDKMIVGYLADTEQLAIYTNCSKVLPLDVVVTSFAMVLIPYIYKRVMEGRRDESIDLFSSYMKVGYYSVWILGMMVLIAPESIISFLYADAYVEGKVIFILYIIDTMLRFASVHLILTAADKAKYIVLYSFISLGINAVLNVLFYYLWGLVGPAIATLVAAAVYTFLILRKTIKVIDAKWSDIFDIKDVLIFAVSVMIVWGAAVGINALLNYVGVHHYISMMISMAFFGLTQLFVNKNRIFGIVKKINAFKL